MLDIIENSDFISSFAAIAERVHRNAREKGFWDQSRNDGEAICLMHEELSEAMSAIRHKNPPSDHMPEFLGTEEELADCIIRIMDLAYARKWRVAEAVIAKMEFNSTRPHMHGKTC